MTGESQSTTNGSLVLALAAVLFAVAFLPFLLEDDSGGGGTAFTGGVATAGPGDTPRLPDASATRRAAPPADASDPDTEDPDAEDPYTAAPDPTYPRPVAPPAPVRDPRQEAFEAAARVGTCLNAYLLGDSAGTWNSEVPRQVPCGAWEAYARVAGVNGTCPTADAGYARWGYGNVSLCLERQFKQGQCFLVSREGGTSSDPQYSGNLFTWADCGAQRIPVEYDSILVITNVYRAPSTLTDSMCRRAANDRTRYWYWLARNNSTLICATYPAR
ncbi:hypothetical protein [Streptodolium elevatio]|uniref:Serine/threonine protein kinase n=1 Tax=Streptodolium elevatio TaxID=3157996 RepID=A0ABV3DGE7_9ACTN